MKVGFLGAGNMGGAILRAIAGSASFETAVYEKSAERAQQAAQTAGCLVLPSVEALVAFADVVLIAVKPVHIDALLQEIAACGSCGSKIYISIAAGVKIERFTAALGEVPIVRTTPTLPALVGEGFTGIYYHNMDGEAFAEARSEIRKIFDSCGKTAVLSSESAIDKLISVTSSSPAYICLMIDALADGAVRAGFPRADAYLMAEQTVYGTARYLLETGTLPAVLKDQVCSPAGTTIEAVVALERRGLRSAVLDAMEACEKKAEGKL